MSERTDEEKLLYSTALQNVKTILQARQRAEEELVAAKETLELHAKQLARSVSTLRATLESTTDAMLVTGADGDIVDYNDKLLRVWGLSRERLAVTDEPSFWHEIASQTQDVSGFLSRVEQIEAIPSESFDTLELADGRVLERYSARQLVDGVAAGRVWSFRDVTERKRHEAELRASHAQFSAIIHHSPVGVMLVDADLHLRQVNPIAEPVLGDIGTALGRDFREIASILWHESIASEILGQLRQTLATGTPYIAHGFTALRKDRGVREHYDCEFHRLTLPHGEHGVVCYFTDISGYVSAQEALRDSEQRVRATFEQAGVGMAVADLDGRFIHVNPRFTRTLGYTVEEVHALSFIEITHPDDRTQTREYIDLLLSGAITDFSLEKRYVRKDGTLVWSLTTVALLRSATGAPERFVGVVEDISDRKRAEQRERESAERLQLALSAGRLGDWSWDAPSDLVTLGERAAQVFGLETGISMTWTELRSLLHPEDRERDRNASQAAMREHSDYDIEYRMNRAAGDETWIAAKGRGVYTSDGHAVGMIGVVQDVTERKRLEISRERLAAVVESSDDAIVSKDLEGIVRTWNAGAERIFGYTAAEMIGTSITRLIPLELRDEERRIIQKLKRGERVDHYRTERVAKDGHRIDVSLTVSPIRDASGRITGASKVARDITTRKREEDDLRRSEEELRSLADFIPQLAWMANADGHVFWYNRGWFEYTGTSLAVMQGDGWKSVHDADVLPRVMARWEECLRTGDPFEMEYPLRDASGSFRWFLTRARPIRDATGAVVRWFGSSTDVDEVKKAREALWDESRLLNLLNETGQSIAVDLDLQLLLQTITDAATQVSGAEFGAFYYNTKDEHGDSYRLFASSGAEREAFQEFSQQRATPLFAPTFDDLGPLRCDDVREDARYEEWGDAFRGHLDVRSYLAVPVVSRSGEVIGALFFGHSAPRMFTERIERVVTGITAQAAIAIDNARLYERVKRAAEDRQALLDAERSARAEAERVNSMKDEFLATLSHELRTPLNAIVGWSQVLRMRGHADPEFLDGLSVIDRNAKMQSKLIEDLLDMSRIISGKLRIDVQQVDVQEVVQAAIASVRHSAESKGIRLQVVVDPHAGPVRGDPNRLLQCFWNLLSNAIKFTQKGGRVQVGLARVDSYLEFTVVDDGQGIAPEFLPYVFERFRQADASTTRRYGGLGLGLSIVKSLVELHGGCVRASSAGKGQGATFCIELPVMVVGKEPRARKREHPTADARREVSTNHPSLAGLTVLAVDDEPDARDLIRRVLEDCGARVLVADSARTGLEILQREKPDVLLSDIGMPEEDGYTFIRQVRALDVSEGGRIPAAALSAFARPEDRTRALRAGYQMHLSKPVEPVELTVVVASLALRK